ncbi:MAG: MinD/ParA family protein [Desulfobacterales bacterium]|jgi:flagellar biosynthesis protein FlhG|nr:MinD/ParA family protein [Desulfobacterales bacterium]
MPRIITVTSGKGGVGKTNISVNLALQLATRGYRTCLFDADMGLANINILLGIYPEVNLAHVINGEKTLSDIIIHNYMGIDIVPGGTGISKLANLQAEQIEPILTEFKMLDDYDFVIFDTSAGAGGDVTAFCRAASQMLLIITPEPTSLTDAYSLLKILSAQGFTKHVLVAVNQARHLQHAKIPYLSLSRTVAKHLPLKISAIGFITQDAHVTEAVRLQKPFISLYPKAMASICIRKIAERLISGKVSDHSLTDMKTFWSEYLGLRDPVEKQPKPQQAESSPLPVSNTSPAGLEPVLNEIAHSLSAISVQLGAIRQLMELRLKRKAPSVAHQHPATDNSQAIPILLDFENFLKEKQNGGTP